MKIKKTGFYGFFVLLSILIFTQPVSMLYADEVPEAFRSTDYPLPRYVSLGSDKIYVRTGPGQRYPIKWIFKKRTLPVEIILEYESWRKVRDHEGDEGWVHTSLLSGRRTALVQGEAPLDIRSRPATDKRLLARFEPGVIASVEACKETWCKIEAKGYKGWAQRKFLWGVYENEQFD